MQSKSVLQLYYADHSFTDSLRTICQNAISSITDNENDSNYNQLFLDLEEYWKTDHNIEVMLTVPSSISSDKTMNNISLFLNYLPFVYINNTAQPKTSGAKVSFCDRITADWTKPRVRIAFRTAIDIIYAIFVSLVLQNKNLSANEVDSVVSQMRDYLDIDKEYPDYGKFRIISSRYFAKAIEVLSKAQPEFVFKTFFESLRTTVKAIKKQSEKEPDQKYMLNIVLCLYSRIKINNSQFTIDTKMTDKVFSKLYSILSKKSKYDQTLQKDACACLTNFFGVVLSNRPLLCDSAFLTNMIKLTAGHCKIFSIFYMLLTLLYCFDKSKHTSAEKKKFIYKVLTKKKMNYGDTLNVFTFFLRGGFYAPDSEIESRNISLTEKDFSWVPDPCVNQDVLNKMYMFIFSDPKAFSGYQKELSEFLIQYASINYSTFINNVLEKILDLNYFKPNAIAVLSVGKVLLIAGRKASISKDLINKMNRMLTNTISEVMKNTTDEGKSCTALHVQPFWPIYTSHEMDFNESLNYILQCCNPLSFHIHPENISKIIKSKWSNLSSISVKTNIFDYIESTLQIYNNVSTTDQILINVMTIIPHFPNEKSLVTDAVSLIFSPLTDVSALAIRLVQTILIKSQDCSVFDLIITEAFGLKICTNEILYTMLYSIDELLEVAINLRLTLEDSRIDLINYAVIVSLCSQNSYVHSIALSVISHLHSIQPLNSIEYLLEKYDPFISYHSKRSSLLMVTEKEDLINDAPDISFKTMAKSNYPRLYLFYLASLARCFSVEYDEMKTKSLIEIILDSDMTKEKWDPFIFTGIVTFLANSFNINMAYIDSTFFKNYKLIVCDTLLQDPRLEEWNGFHIFSAVDIVIDPSLIKTNAANLNQNRKYHEENARYRYNSMVYTDDEFVSTNEINDSPLNFNDNSILADYDNRYEDVDLNFEWLAIKPSSNVIIQAIALAIRTSINESLEIETATNYITYLSSIVKYLKKQKLIHSKLTFSYSATLFAQFEDVVRVVLDAAAAAFSIFYERFNKVPAGPYMRREIMGKNISVYFDVEKWFIFILNFISHKQKKSTITHTNPVRPSSLNALSALLSISPPPKSIYSKFIKSISKYDDRSLSLILSYYTEKLLPTFVSKALSSENVHSSRYFNAIVNQFAEILPKDFIPKCIDYSLVNHHMSADEISFADAFFAHTGTIIALAFTHITTDDKESRLRAFSLLFNVAVGAATYLNKPESVVIISDQMQSLMFAITSQLTNLYTSALQSISMLLSQELNIVSEQVISIILDSMANGGNSVLLASILAPWIKGSKFDDDSPIVFTATQPQFACFTRFSFAKSFSRIKLTTSLFFVIDSLLTTPGAASFLTIALSSLYQSDPITYSNVTSTISYILQQRPSECVPIITSIFMFSSWFYYNIQLKSIKEPEEPNIEIKEQVESNPLPPRQSVNLEILKKQQVISKQITKILRGSAAINIPHNLTAPDSPVSIPHGIAQSTSDPNLKLALENNYDLNKNSSIYENIIRFASTTISSTNLQIYNGYEHRLYAHALITLDTSIQTGNSSLVPFLIPQITTFLNQSSNENNESGTRDRNRSNADQNLSIIENLNLKGDKESDNSLMNDGSTLSFKKQFPGIDFEYIVMKQIRNKGNDFAQKLGNECLTWGLCCGNLNYAIRALFIYRKILLPANQMVITKLVDCTKLASNAYKTNKVDSSYLLRYYIANCLETIRVVAEKIEFRSIELWELCISFISVNCPELQTIVFNFLAFLVNDIEFIRKFIHIPQKEQKEQFNLHSTYTPNKGRRKSSFKITNSILDQYDQPNITYPMLIKKIDCGLDKESFMAFYNFVLCATYQNLIEIIGSMEFVAAFILILLPLIHSYNQNEPTNLTLSTSNNSTDLMSSFNIGSKRRRKSIVTIEDPMKRSSLVEKTDQISKIVNDNSNANNSNSNNNSPTHKTPAILEDNGYEFVLSLFSLFEAKIDDYLVANKLSELAQSTPEEINEENTIDTVLYICENLLEEDELEIFCKLLACTLSFSSAPSSNRNSTNNLVSNSNSTASIISSQSSLSEQQLINSNTTFVYKFALELLKSDKCKPEILFPIVRAEDLNIGNFKLKSELINELESATGTNINDFRSSNLYCSSNDEDEKPSEEQNSAGDETKHNLQDSNAINLPFYPKIIINNNFPSFNDFSAITILPPLYILNTNDCPSNLAVLEAIQRIRAQPLDSWTDLTFRAETTTQIEALKSMNSNKPNAFRAEMFVKQLRNLLNDKNKEKEKEKSSPAKNERRFSNDSLHLDNGEVDEDILDLDSMIQDSFALETNEFDQIWKDSIRESGGNLISLTSLKL